MIQHPPDASQFQFNEVVVDVAIADLRPHPRQAEIFVDVSDAELQALAADIEANGQREPIHILPDMTVLAGHQRIRAMELLGRAMIHAVVRHDLRGKTNESTEFFVNDNMSRRHLDPMAIARCFDTLRATRNSNPGPAGARKFKTMKAAMMGRLASIGCQITERSLNRYTRLLKLPRHVQDAISQKRLTMRDAASILDRCPRDQQIIAVACADGMGKKELAKLLAKMRGKPRSFAIRRFGESVGVLVAIGRTASHLDEVVDRYSGDEETVGRLKDAQVTIADILKRIYEQKAAKRGSDKLSARSRTTRGT